MKYVVIFVLALALLVLGPLLTIWSLNVLFPSLSIDYTIETGAAVVILGGLFNVRKSK